MLPLLAVGSVKIEVWSILLVMVVVSVGVVALLEVEEAVSGKVQLLL